MISARIVPLRKYVTSMWPQNKTMSLNFSLPTARHGSHHRGHRYRRCRTADALHGGVISFSTQTSRLDFKSFFIHYRSNAKLQNPSNCIAARTCNFTFFTTAHRHQHGSRFVTSAQTLARMRSVQSRNATTNQLVVKRLSRKLVQRDDER